MTIAPKSQSKLYPKNKSRLSCFAVTSGFTVMTFGDELRKRLDEKGMRPAELARRSGITKQGIGRLLNNTVHWETKAAPQPERETVEKIAKALDWDADAALLSAGYFPTDDEDILRLAVVMFHDWRSLTPEQKEELLTTVRRVAAGMLTEQGKE